MTQLPKTIAKLNISWGGRREDKPNGNGLFFIGAVFNHHDERHCPLTITVEQDLENEYAVVEGMDCFVQLEIGPNRWRRCATMKFVRESRSWKSTFTLMDVLGHEAVNICAGQEDKTGRKIEELVK